MWSHYPRKEMLEHQGIPVSETNLAEVYQNAGYKTALIGKWHLGFGPEHLPQNRGFDYHYGFLGAFSRYTEEEKILLGNVLSFKIILDAKSKIFLCRDGLPPKEPFLKKRLGVKCTGWCSLCRIDCVK